MDWQQLMQAVGPYFGGMPSQQAPTPGQGAMAGPANPQAQPQMQYGAGDILGSPAVQGGLDAFFGYLASGGRNRWEDLGRGGLMGLQGYSMARANQLAAPLRAAELKKTQAEAAKTGMETQQLQQQITGRQAFANAFRQTSTYKSMNPQQAELTASALQAGIYKPEDIMRTPIQQEEFNLKLRDQARADKAQAETQRYHNASIERMKAMEGNQQQEIGLRGAALGIEGARLRETQLQDAWRRNMGAGTGPITPKEEAALAKQAHDMAVKDAGPSPRPPVYGGRLGDLTGSNAKADADYRAKLQQWQANVKGFDAAEEAKLMNRVTANRSARRAVATAGADEETGGGPPPIPEGTKPWMLPDGTLGYMDASGKFTSMEGGD